MLKLLLLVAFASLIDRTPAIYSENLLTNPGFENGLEGWSCKGCSFEIVTDDVKAGKSAVKVTKRKNSAKTIAQDIPIKKGRHYQYKSFIKLLNDKPGKLYQEVKLIFNLKYAGGGSNNLYIGTTAYIYSGHGWSMLGGDLAIPDEDFASADVRIINMDAEIDYLYDEAELYEITDNPNWKEEANARIEQIRKSNMNFEVTLPAAYDKKDIKIEIIHKKHQFGWGCLIDPYLVNEPDYAQYKDIFTYMFEYALMNNFKMKQNKGNWTHPNYDVASDALDKMLDLGLKVRSHSYFWASEGHNPKWIEELTGDDLLKVVDERIAYQSNLTKGRIDQWVVSNEHLHGRVYEINSGDPELLSKMFKKIRAADPKPVLFLNDFAIVNRGIRTQSFFSQIERIKNNDVGLGAVSVQSHLVWHVKPNPTLIKMRLDTIAEAGVPIWVAAMDYYHDDEKLRADYFEDMWRLYFSYPSMDGLIMFKVWDRHSNPPEEAIVHGYHYEMSESAKRYLKLIKEEWSTHVTQSLASGTDFTVRGFHGDYDAYVYHNGKPIKRKSFTLGKRDKTVTISLSGDEKEITVNKIVNPFEKPTVVDPKPVTLTGIERKVGEPATSTSQDSQLKCVTRKSEFATKRVIASCEDGEVLTSCSAWLDNNDFRINGEQIKVDKNGKQACEADNGFESFGSVQAIARCCAMKDLKCSYKKAGPTLMGIDDRVELKCPEGAYATGCATYNNGIDSDGSFFAESACYSQNDNPSMGTNGYAACCEGGGMTCSTVKSSPSGQLAKDKAQVSCPSGTVMTGCNYFSQYGRSAGAYIEGTSGSEVCTAVNGYRKFGAETGVVAMATCCKV